ncbi:hypothetical protein DWG14_02815 [Streptomyces griseorubiginosus]|uniref:Uncharacterized protein n=1 Tax=Streptomyces griseorubiginosus TaxID=67304 RepID=A0AAI8PN18_9ACTN|nr:hypothetical protein DWG14_02815 [Streptomyces griseorubiginosus]
MVRRRSRLSAVVPRRCHALRHSCGVRCAELARHLQSGCRPEGPAKRAPAVLLLQAALIDRLLQHSLTDSASVLQIRSLSVGARAPVTYRPVRTNVLNQPQPSCIHAELKCDQATRKLDVDHQRRVGAGLSAWEAAGTCGVVRALTRANGRGTGSSCSAVSTVVPREICCACGARALMSVAARTLRAVGSVCCLGKESARPRGVAQKRPPSHVGPGAREASTPPPYQTTAERSRTERGSLLATLLARVFSSAWPRFVQSP